MYCSPRLLAGLAAACSLAAIPRTAPAATFTNLYNFGTHGTADANNPYAGVILDNAGNLYGTTYGGGTSGLGTVYELSPPAAGQTAWSETILYSFYTSHQDGVAPTGRLVFGPGGVLYGTTTRAGGPGGNADGTVFALTPPVAPGAPWTETTLHVFTQADGDGGLPEAGLAIDAGGTLYGTTNRGGTAKKKSTGFGTVFSLSPPAAGGTSWTETILYTFSNTTRDGISPQSDILLGGNGTLYGTTPYCSDKLSCSGTVFALAGGPGAWTESVLLALPSNGDKGASPFGSLSIDPSGALYGTTNLGTGTAFRLAPPTAGQTRWTQSVLAKFGSDKDGGPQGGLLPGPGGVLFGTLTYGPHKAQGEVFQLTPKPSGPWTQTVLYTFPSKPVGSGSFPVGDLVADANGNLYGVTEIGGTYGVGTVFEITP